MRVFTALFGTPCRRRYVEGNGFRSILCVTRWEPLRAGMLAWTGLTRPWQGHQSVKEGQGWRRSR
jgi:hypothetical protein